MPIDRPTDTPESLRALADELCALSATHDLRLTQVAAALDTAEDAIRRVADRLETPSNADELVRAIDAARRAGAEEMRASIVRWLRASAAPNDGSPIDQAAVKIFMSIAGGVATLPLPGDQP